MALIAVATLRTKIMAVMKSIKHSVMRASREQKLRDFYSHFKDGMTVLDVGVSSEVRNRQPLENYFLKRFRYAPECYTALGVQDLAAMNTLYPGSTFVTYPGGRFPFGDKQFDFVHSNAVIEHVGDEDAQLFFLNEMLRVANTVFFTTPNKFFPIESHTNLFLIHWHDEFFYWWCKRTKRNKRKDNLYLFSQGRLKHLLAKSHATYVDLVPTRFLGVPMTFTVVCSTH